MAGKLKIFVATATVAGAALAAPAANAGLLVSSAQSCSADVLSQPFSKLGDSAQYTPVPGGSFEPGEKAWTLTGGAKVVTGNESYKVRSASDNYSLQIPAGGTATSPSICVGIAKPTVRWFQKSGLLGSMTVSVLTETSLGAIVETPVGAGALSTSWNAGLLPSPIVTNLLPLLGPGQTAVAFRFRAVTGTWNVDDVYVDPWMK